MPTYAELRSRRLSEAEMGVTRSYDGRETSVKAMVVFDETPQDRRVFIPYSTRDRALADV